MLKEIVTQNKYERDELIKGRYVIREQLKQIKDESDNFLIKVVLGPRRSGKSIFSFLFLQDKEFAYLNFDDENLLKVDNYDRIVEALFQVYGPVEYLFFDEIQNLENWELFVSKLKRRKLKMVLSGSNANLLSGELATSLTGRYRSFEILPFSLKEYIQGLGTSFSSDDMAIPEKKGLFLQTAEKYLIQGGYPEVVVDGINPKTYLSTLFDAVLFKDIVTRYQVRYPQNLNILAQFLISNVTSEFTFNSLKNNLNFSSVLTVEKYVSYLENSYLFFSLQKFSYKQKEQIRSPKKAYIIDNGFIFAKAFQFSKDFGRLLENCVLIDLLRRNNSVNKNLFYFKTKNNLEVDFLVFDEGKVKALYQVSYSIDDEKTKSREIRGLISGARELSCDNLYIITWDTEDLIKHENYAIQVIPFWKWTLSNRSQ